MRRLLAGAVLAAAAAAAAPAAEARTGSCGWSGVAPRVPGDWSGVLPQFSDENLNILLGEGGATYWQAWLIPIPRGGHIEFSGYYPHARYTSLTTYGDGLSSIDGIYDEQIAPDPGSANPFLAGADRTTPTDTRRYTVRLKQNRNLNQPREPNTFYNVSPDGTKSGGSLARVSLRIYAPDKNAGRDGGVPLPDITLVGADGRRTTLPECTDPGVPDAGVNAALAGAGSGEPNPLGPSRGSSNPPEWWRFTNFASSVARRAGLGQSVTDGLFPYGGWGDTPDNRYVWTVTDSGYGQILALRAKAPTFAHTRDGEPVMPAGHEVRFWSMCSYGHTTGWYDCLTDDEVPTGAGGEYTIVVSTAAARPRNATAACGVAWLPQGPTTQATLILRNLLAAPSFAEAVQNTQPGTEKAVMGAYYPRGTYYRTTLDFERLGCPVR